MILNGDVNARKETLPIPGIVEALWGQTVNYNGHELTHFLSYNYLKIINSFFRKKNIHKYTWSAKGFK